MQVSSSLYILCEMQLQEAAGGMDGNNQNFFFFWSSQVTLITN